MKKRARRKYRVTKIGGVSIRHMTPDRFLIDLRSVTKGKTNWRSFKTLGEATAYAEQLNVERINRGTEGFNLTDRQRRDALEAIAILGDGVTLAQAAQEYRRRYPDASAESVKETSGRLIEWMRKEGRREISIREAARRLKHFTDDHPDRATQSIDRRDILEWIDARGWQGITAKNYRTAAMTLLNFYHDRIRKRHLRDDRPVSIWDATTVERLMDTAAQQVPELVPALAVLLFAGLRPHEMMRLKWSQIDLKRGHIRLEGEQVKTGSARVIELEPNAIEWLTAYRGTGTLIESPAWYRTRRERLMEAAEVTAWPKDVTRHSFASYLYAMTDDAAKVTSALGHWQGLEMFRRHYRAVTTKAEAERYFSITPKAGRMISLKTA